MICKGQSNNQLRLFVKFMHKLGTETARKQEGEIMFWPQYQKFDILHISFSGHPRSFICIASASAMVTRKLSREPITMKIIMN